MSQARDEEDWVDSGCGACGPGRGCDPLPFSVPWVLGCGETGGHPRDEAVVLPHGTARPGAVHPPGSVCWVSV